MRILTILLLLGRITLIGLAQSPLKGPSRVNQHNLFFTKLATTWDEGLPLGNGVVGTLVWENAGQLRLSLDRADLWDLRPMYNLSTPKFSYQWVYEQWKNQNYQAVQEAFNVPYDQNPGPTKIPAAAIEFAVESFGEVEHARLVIREARAEIRWKNGVTLQTFVHANDPVGWFRFEGLSNSLTLELVPPAYNLEGTSEAENPVEGQDLRRLEYPVGSVIRTPQSVTYEQEGWGGFKYQVHVQWRQRGDVLEGTWSISTNQSADKNRSAQAIAQQQLTAGWSIAYDWHQEWWKAFWAKSSIHLPDSVLERQWYLELYKFGSAARKGAPPIALQSVWTADNGKLPPWKGDFHHDLNTQLSYWPAYSGNHLEEAEGYVDWLWQHRGTFKKYTATYYEADGLNVPGVTTLEGKPMGGWIQYAFGPTVAGWLGQHFYLHWRYSMDQDFLQHRAYPWIADVATYLDEVSVKDQGGQRKLPVSASPEIYNNSAEAWFGRTTNFDLAQIRWTYEKAAELASALGKKKVAQRWEQILGEWPDLAIDSKQGLLLAPDYPLPESHRHHSHLLGYHPLGILDYSQGNASQKVIDNSLATLDALGTKQWVGYSYSWLGNMRARAFDGEGAAEALRIFATAFCLPNSFHVNGDQSGNGYSDFTYRPFTLEGNFAFAAGIQEMLLQSHTDAIHVFPAIPEDWDQVSFRGLRAQGAFVVSAKKSDGQVENVEILSEKGMLLKIKNPFGSRSFRANLAYEQQGNTLVMETNPMQEIRLDINK